MCFFCLLKWKKHKHLRSVVSALQLGFGQALGGGPCSPRAPREDGASLAGGKGLEEPPACCRAWGAALGTPLCQKITRRVGVCASFAS